MNEKIISTFVFTIAAAATLLSCGPGSESGDRGTERNEVKFFSSARPGPWKAQASDHEPEITITKTVDRKTIYVRIPFAQPREKSHHVEAIAVLDLDRKELQKATFENMRADKGARFDFSADYNSPVYIVMKCNLHDMWEKLVYWKE
jgi:desulfoferrodoxin (superoxide reductase-like protein)